ncbi:MAG TPA: ABC transporter permease [Pirellulales bacterium]|jgi:putative ABC transport system permease protein
MRLFTLVYRNITRRRVRSALTICGMAVAVSAVVALVGIADGFEQSFLKLFEGHDADIIVSRARSADRMASELDESLGPKIAAVSGVDKVEPVLFDTVALPELPTTPVVLQGLDPDSKSLVDLHLVAGRAPTAQDHKAVMVGQMLAANLGKNVDDTIEIYEGEDCRIVGVYNGESTFENGAIILPLRELQRMLGQQGLVNIFNVTVQHPTTDEAVKKVVDELNGLHLGITALATKLYVASDPKIQGAKAMAWSTSAIALIVGAIGMLNTMIVSVFERTSEIGVLRAIGWRKSRIFRMILLESGILCVAGSVFGTLLALLMTFALSRAPATNGLISSRVSPAVIVQGFEIAMLIGLFGAIYPAIRATRLLPTVALRHEG